MSPLSGPPGTLVDLTGDWYTDCFLRDNDTNLDCADDDVPRIRRIYMGAQQCQMLNQTTGELYQGVERNKLRCQVNKPEIGYFNASVLVTNNYGRTFPSLSTFQVSPNNDLFMFQTYAGMIHLIFGTFIELLN